MEEEKKPSKVQKKKKTKKSKFRRNDGTVDECSYETLPQDTDSVQDQQDDEETFPHAARVSRPNAEVASNVVHNSPEESVRLLESPGTEHFEVQPNVNNENELPNYMKHLQVNPISIDVRETELNEIRLPIGNVESASHLVVTVFDSPAHTPSSPTIDLAEDILGLWIDETEIANEASPSAPSDEGQMISSSEHSRPIPEVTTETVNVIKDKPFFPFMNKEEGDCDQILKPFTLSQLAALYHNQELVAAEQFVAQFVESETRSGDVLRHPLYELLTNYLRARKKLNINKIELDVLKYKCEDHMAQLWSVEKCVVTEHGECQDGNPVEASHEFKTAHYNQNCASNLCRSLCAIREMSAEQFALNAYTCEAVKLKVEDYVQKLESEFSFLSPHAAVCLMPEGLPSLSHTGRELRVVIGELRQAVSVLFSFQRRPVRDDQFVADTRAWLSNLVAVLLRVATWRDHLFLLHHTLRCPAGVAKWATSFIQPPVSPFNSPLSSEYLDHLVTSLASVLLPIQGRDVFLNQMVVSTEDEHLEGESAWFLVDSEGEDEADTVSLRESDIVAFLNQVPLDAIFRHMLNITSVDNRNVQNAPLADHQILKLIAFCHLLLNLLEDGLKNHASGHQQYAKRLGRLVRHTVQYATDEWEMFRAEGLSRDPAMMMRLSVEYDALLSRAVITLYSSPSRSAWQFLAVLPFGSVSMQMLWKLFQFVMLGDTESIDDETQWNVLLEDQLGGMTDVEIYYVMTAINNMALGRTTEDWVFIRSIMLQLLEIGFLNGTTRDACYKSARIMLTNLTLKYPSLISDIVARLNVSSNCGKQFSVYLVKDLPIAQWRPADTDLNTLECWLTQHPIQSVKHGLGRFIVSALNLGFVSEKLSDELFLPRAVHVRLAMIVLKTAVKWCPQGPPEANTITETIRQMASLAALMTRPKSSEQALTVWVWQTAYKLHLHLLDQENATRLDTLANPSTALNNVPELDCGSEDMELLSNLLKNHQAMAIYMSLQVSSQGHNIPLICNRGFALMTVLLSCQLYTAVISLLQNLVPLFLTCQTTLLESEKFRSVLLALLSADRTFYKTAKSLIATDFPGHILQQLGDMIQHQLDDYSKYNNNSTSKLLGKLWLQILCTVWRDEPKATSYLLDVILSCAVISSDITSMAHEYLGMLLKTLISTTQANSRLASLFSWVSGNPTASLVPEGSSTPHAPWYAYFALHVEESHTQGTNGLWREVVKELAITAGKPNVDGAIKKACGTLKLSVISAMSLSIHRWSQQILDTSVDHPVLPLLWQRFFILFFTHHTSPTGVDHGSVGYKLFEGLAYQPYQKRLKRKLNDCIEYFRTKAGAQNLPHEKHLLYDTLSNLYETFSMWLEEPRLHEPDLYVPALPPQFRSKLVSIMTSSPDQNPWYEYVDYSLVRVNQEVNIERWLKTQGRESSSQSQPPMNSENLNPMERINKRLQSYDHPVPPPSLRRCEPVIPPVTRDSLTATETMLGILEPSFRAVLDYAQSYVLRVSEHTALDCTLLELLPCLYTHVESEITLYAACDTAKPNSRPPSANALNCAGPALIYIKVSPASINEAVKQLVENNRSEMDGVLKQSLQSPSTRVCVASVHIEHATRMLEKECLELKRIGDVQLLNPLKKVGVALFYHLSGMFADEAVAYPPLKQLLTTCIESLGNTFISGEEEECARLLTSVLQNPPLAGLLGPHFTPAAANPGTFLQMYCTLVDWDQTSPDLLFVLLSKFDMNQWLRDRRPKLVERSQVIELAGKALATAGLTPTAQILPLHGIFRNHLATIFMYDFPEHYGEVLALVLRHSQAQSLSPEVLFDLVNSLASSSGGTGVKVYPGLSQAQLKEMMKKYATEQRLLSVRQLMETSSMLGGHFTKERLQYGLYGLYPKYRNYLEPIVVLMGMLGHALVVATLHSDSGVLSDKLLEQLWPPLVAMFAPWLVPYFTSNLTEPTAAWIQQLTDDRSVLPPWIVADGGHAQKLASMFVECIRFMMDLLPAASSTILTCVWQFYVTNFAHSSVKDHVLSVIHGVLISLPWQRFSPTIQDIDLMLKVVDQYLPDCHTFVGAIFIQVSWAQWVQQVCPPQNQPVASGVHSALLHLLIKLANEPNVRQSGKVTPLLLESQKLAWHLIDSNSYEAVVNWFVMSYDPRVILQIPGEDWSNTDMAALDLLELVAGYSSTTTVFHTSTPRKRQMYVRACVKLLLTALSRHKQLTTSHQTEIKATVRRMVDKVETVIVATVQTPHQRVSEAGMLLTEILGLVNQGANSVVATLALEALLGWLETRTAVSTVVAAMMRVLGITVANPDTLGALLEASLIAFFRKIGVADSPLPSWSMVVSTIQPVVPRHPPLEDTLITNGQLLTLYSLFLNKQPVTLDVREEASLLNDLNQWLAAIKVTAAVESKLPLLWSQALYLAWRQCEYSSDAEAGPLTLRRLITSVAQGADQRAGAWGLLGAIGIVKSTAPTNKCRLLSRFLVALGLAQLPDSRNNNAQEQPQFVRTKAHAPGAISNTSVNMGYVSSSEAMKALSALESLATDKNFADIKTTVESAVRLVRQAENSLHNAHQLVIDIARQLYTDPYLHAHRLTDKPQA